MRAVIALLLIFITATLARLPPVPQYRCGWSDSTESDIAWVPAAIWAGKALAGGALGAAGKHAYDRVFRRDAEESDQVVYRNGPAGYGAYTAKPNTSLIGKTIKSGNDYVTLRNGRSGWGWYKAGTKDSIESDSEFLGLLVGGISAAVKAGKAIKGLVQRRREQRQQSQADFPFIPAAIGAWKLYNAIKKRDEVESEFLGKWVQTGKKIYETGKKYYPKAKAVYGEGKNIYNSVKNIRNIIKSKDETESEFLGLLVGGISAAVKAGKAIKGLVQKRREKKQQSQSDFLSLLTKIPTIIKAGKTIKDLVQKRREKKQQSQSDFLGAVKLGFKAFKAIKALKQKKQQKKQQQPESDLKALIENLKSKIAKKLAEKKAKKAEKKQQQSQ